MGESTQVQNQGYELTHPNIHLISELLEHEKDVPTDPKLQDSHDTGQQEDIQEEPQREPIMDGVAEASLEPDQ